MNKYSCMYVLLIFLTINFFAYADAIRIHNKTQDTLALAIYYSNKKATRATSVAFVTKGKSITIQRPKRKFGKDRELIFDYTAQTLKSTLTKQEVKQLPSINVGMLEGQVFYLAKKEGRLKAYNQLEWKLFKPIKTGVTKPIEQVTNQIKNQIKKSQSAITQNPHKSEVARVRIGNSLSPEERAYMQKRLPKVKKALEVLLGKSLDNAYIPTIAFVASGGGYRAMLSTIGYLVGAENIGLLDATSYITALSGSTWALGAWQASGLSINAFKEKLIAQIRKKLEAISPNELKIITDALLVKVAFDEPITIVDLYGALLANVLLSNFGNARQRIHVSQQVENIKNGEWIFPIYTAIRAEEGAKSEWYEFTPYEVGASWLGMYVPIWAYGRKFVNGKSIDFAPEQSLGFLLGTFGSAFAAQFNQIYSEISGKIKPAFMRKIVKEVIVKPIGEKRFTGAKVFNFSVGVSQSPLRELKTIKLVDAGVAPGFNLPYPPVSGERAERKADILIFFDASDTKTPGRELQKVEHYARSHNLKFPTIDYKGINQEAMSIFKDKNDPEVPVVIYLPVINDLLLWNQLKQESEFEKYKQYLEGFDVKKCLTKGYCDTFNFSYSDFEARQLSALTEFNISNPRSKKQIIDAINWVIARKSVTKTSLPAK